MKKTESDFETKIFCVKHNECVGFESKWKVKKVSSENATQTTELRTSEQGCSPNEHKHIEIQTETDQKSSNKEETDMTRLAEWLNSMYPKIFKELDSASSSRVFKNYYRLEEDSALDATCKLVQEVKIFTKEGSGDTGLNIVACIAWNSAGNMLAVTQNFNHKTWCHHPALVLVYVLNRDGKFSDIPKKKLATETCVTALTYHTSNSTILVAGTFTGQVYIWDIQNDIDSLVLTVNAHDEFVTQLSWINDMDSKNSVLASASLDGFLKLWKFRKGESNFQLKTKYKIKTPILGKTNYTSEINQHLLEKGDLGIVCFDFSKYVDDTFVVALEGGLIVQCSLLGATEIKGSTKEEPLYDPVYKYYPAQEGEITAVRFSPTHRDMFLTSSTDGEIRIYVLNQEEPAQIIFTPDSQNDVFWVPQEGKLLVGCSRRGKLDIFNLITGKLMEYPTNTKTDRTEIPCLAMNLGKFNYVATGNNKGHFQLWDVPWQAIKKLRM